MSVRNEVLVDIDGVLANFDASVEALFVQKHPEIEIVRPRSEYYIHQDFAEEHQAAIKGIWQAVGFYRQLGMVEAASEGWARMVDSVYKPRFCSSPIPQNPRCIDEKKAWLEEYFVPAFGSKIIDEAIFDRDKYKYEALALIDDKPEIQGAEQASWEHVIFDAPYNKLSLGRFRLLGWTDPNLIPMLDTLRKL